MKKPAFKIRSQQTIFHHVFKALQEKFLKDLSFGSEDLRIDKIEHVHHYHSVNSMGHAQKYTTMVGGHFHEVTWTTDSKTGEPVAKCGPAMKKLTKNTSRGTKTSVEPLKFFNKEHQQWFSDDHVHSMAYLGSDELSTSHIQDIQRQNATFLQSQSPRETTEATMTDGDRE